jgi:ABC-type transport system involved in multi-copper enzyme maturation permease subunit
MNIKNVMNILNGLNAVNVIKIMQRLKPIWIIATNTFREIIRDRILYGIAVFALLLMGVSLVLGQLSFSEQARISADFGFAGIQIGTAAIAIFLGSTLVSREIEKQTILTLLARPISRSDFLVGKFVGLALVISLVLMGLSFVLAGVLTVLNFALGGAFFVAILGVLFEGLILVAITLFFGSFARPTTTTLFSVATFLIGHWVGSLNFFIEKSNSALFKIVGQIVTRAMPDLEVFNWRAAPIYGVSIPLTEVLRAGLNAFGWLILLLSLSMVIFRRRDFV